MFRRDGSSAAATTHWTVRSLGDDGALFKREQESALREARGLRVKAHVPSVHPRLKYILLTNGDGQTPSPPKKKSRLSPTNEMGRPKRTGSL